MGKASRGRGRGRGRRGHLASAIARLWPPARKHSIATRLLSPEASPSQTPEPGGQTDPFPVCLPSSIIENKRTRETEKPKIKKPNAPSVKDTGKGGGEGERSYREAPGIPPQLGRGVGGRTPVWGGVSGAVTPRAPGLAQATGPQGNTPTGRVRPGPTQLDGRFQAHFSWDMPHAAHITRTGNRRERGPGGGARLGETA